MRKRVDRSVYLSIYLACFLPGFCVCTSFFLSFIYPSFFLATYMHVLINLLFTPSLLSCLKGEEEKIQTLGNQGGGGLEKEREEVLLLERRVFFCLSYN